MAPFHNGVAVWLSGSALISINEVALRRTRMTLRWVTVSGLQLPMRENLNQYITSHPSQLTQKASLRG